MWEAAATVALRDWLLGTAKTALAWTWPLAVALITPELQKKEMNVILKKKRPERAPDVRTFIINTNVWIEIFRFGS